MAGGQMAGSGYVLIAPRNAQFDMNNNRTTLIPTVVESTAQTMPTLTLDEEKKKKNRAAQERCRNKKQKELDELKKRAQNLEQENCDLRAQLNELTQKQQHTVKKTDDITKVWADCKALLAQCEESKRQVEDLTHQLAAANVQLEEMEDWKKKFVELEQMVKSCQCHYQEEIEDFTDDDFMEIFPEEILKPHIEEADRYITALMETMDEGSEGDGPRSSIPSLKITIEQQLQVIDDHKENIENLQLENRKLRQDLDCNKKKYDEMCQLLYGVCTQARQELEGVS